MAAQRNHRVTRCSQSRLPNGMSRWLRAGRLVLALFAD